LHAAQAEAALIKLKRAGDPYWRANHELRLLMVYWRCGGVKKRRGNPAFFFRSKWGKNDWFR